MSFTQCKYINTEQLQTPIILGKKKPKTLIPLQRQKNLRHLAQQTVSHLLEKPICVDQAKKTSHSFSSSLHLLCLCCSLAQLLIPADYSQIHFHSPGHCLVELKMTLWLWSLILSKFLSYLIWFFTLCTYITHPLEHNLTSCTLKKRDCGSEQG